MRDPGNRKWWALGALALSLLAVGLDGTILSVALPTLAIDLHASTRDLQWFVNAYNLVLAAMLLPAGLLGDRFGRKKLLLGALALFGTASLACAFAGSASLLIVARAVLGLGAAFLMPLSMAVVSVLFSAEERPRAIAIWVTATAIGLPLGPILGGLLLNNFWWGSVFLINVPLIVVALIAVSLLVPETRNPNSPPLDIIGVLTSSLGLIGLTYGMIEAGTNGWGDPGTLITIVAGAVLLVGFVLWQQRTTYPLIDLSLFRSASFTWGTILATMVSFAMFGLLFTMPQYFQAVNGADALGTGLRLLPVIGGLMVGAQTANRLMPRLGVKITAALGCLLLAAGLAAGATTGPTTGYGFAGLWIGVVGLGLGFTMPTAMDAALGALSPERSGVGSALIQALRQVGGTIGVALLGTILNSAYRSQLDLAGLPAPVADTVRKSAAAGVAVAHQLGSAPLLDSIRAAFVHGMDLTLWVCSGIAILGMVLALVFLPQHRAVVADQDATERPEVEYEAAA